MLEPDTLLRDLSDTIAPRKEARMRIADHMTDGDLKLSMAGKLNESQQALWREAFEAGNQEFENAELSKDEITRWKYRGT